MSMYINMEMPKAADEMVEIVIFGDGRAIQTGESWRSPEDGKYYYTPTTQEKFYQAIEVTEPHGDLIDLKELENVVEQFCLEDEHGDLHWWNALMNADIVIPAEEE